MQTVAAYLLERRDDMQWSEARLAEAARLRDVVSRWLKAKGASTTEATGTYKPEDGSVGTFSTQEATDAPRSWWMLQMDEQTPEGRRFSVATSVLVAGDRVAVYITLDTGWATEHIKPVSADARCPRVVRQLLAVPGSWHHGGSKLCQLVSVKGFDEGEGLAAEIDDPTRAVPVVVVSTHEGCPALPNLDDKVAHDLAGLANVVTVDDEASWALTDCLGSAYSCYSGAVRLYWPHFSTKDDRFSHPLWTRERLRSAGVDVLETRERFRSQLRSIVFRAAALSVTRPREIDEIHAAARARAIAVLKERASSLEEYRELADSYASDNDRLRSDQTALQVQIEELKGQVAKLESDRQALLAHLRAAKGTVPTEAATTPADVIAPSADDAAGEEPAPEPGEVRFYKKAYSRPTHDVMIRVQDCGCNTWEGAHAADKARKGIARMEKGCDNWKSIQHCASCTGGGMWRVRW